MHAEVPTMYPQTTKYTTTMRRAQSVRNYHRPSPSVVTDDLGLLREGDEPTEDMLRRQLLDKDRENDKVVIFIPFMHVEALI
jgi:hypothetical protein